MTFYIAPRFLNKLAVHITKNFLDLPKVKVPLILGIHGRKGEGKTFQCQLVYQKMGVEVVHISAGELESPDAGDPARLIRLRYREAAELIRVRGKMAVLMINDLDAGAGRVDQGTQYTVNTQLVNATLMNIADNPTNVQLPGSYDDTPLHRPHHRDGQRLCNPLCASGARRAHGKVLLGTQPRRQGGHCGRHLFRRWPLRQRGRKAGGLLSRSIRGFLWGAAIAALRRTGRTVYRQRWCRKRGFPGG